MDRRTAALGMFFAVYGSMSSPAHAYLDPATGSIALQALLGAVATWMMYSRMFAAKARMFFARLAGKRQGAEDTE